MRRTASVAVALAAMASGLVSAVPATAAAGSPAAASSVDWTDCGTANNPTMQCAAIDVPLDHARPEGRQIQIAVNRIPATAEERQGPLLVNPGGPGGSGLGLAGYVARSLPADVAAQYDVIGFDPRGVGKSEPALECKPGYFDATRPDSVPHDFRTFAENISRAASFAVDCGIRHEGVLKHINTRNTARDMDAIRAALGAEQINFFGYSYGTYLGSVYAELFPERVRRMVLDSIVDPTKVWYEANISQNYAFDERFTAFTAWIAEHDATYGLGTDAEKVEARWYDMRTAMRDEPAKGVVGPAELEESFLPGGYYNGYWPAMAEAFAAYVHEGDEQALLDLYDDYGKVTGTNGYSVYTAVECRDAKWPRDWGTWYEDARETYRKAPFLTWSNTWYNAPCAFWPTRQPEATDVRNDDIPPVLLFQATDDAATPYAGGVKMHRLLDDSRLVVEEDGGNHGITLGGNACLDRYLTEYLADGTLPDARRGVDATCDTLPEPEPAHAASAQKGERSAPSADRADGAELHRLLGARP
ncbi:alpha/beta hydrolase [Streptomyces sp. RKND-216]|uniref:alpha/beta hydrolase n=1 Tax=Streptomyces sp. RKND-216 TaxID=2562581 RepID=UPI00109E0274|nr:alpha/beta hydrolase [Streptomyces sp. RKND-216]THA25608.1 alpha/beta hydrolase [Streptomyces sp. RKND-216]